jgi:hypothetical protein
MCVAPSAAGGHVLWLLSVELGRRAAAAEALKALLMLLAPFLVCSQQGLDHDMRVCGCVRMRRTEEFIELQVPPDAGNGAANAGVLRRDVQPWRLVILSLSTDCQCACGQQSVAVRRLMLRLLQQAAWGAAANPTFVPAAAFVGGIPVIPVNRIPDALMQLLLCIVMPAVCAGVSLARLLWHVPVPAMVTLIASLLLERRVLVVGQSRDMVSAAVLAAQALIHPFRCAAQAALRCLNSSCSDKSMQQSA